MNILLINHEFPPVGGGAATACEVLAKSLVSLGHDVEVVTSRTGFLKKEEFHGAYRIRRMLGFRRSIFAGELFEMFCFLVHGFIYFTFFWKNKKKDVVYAFFTLPAGLLALFIKKKYNIPYIVFLRGIDVPGWIDVPGLYQRTWSFFMNLLTPLIACIWSQADRVIANSNTLKDMASRSFKNKEIAVLPNMIDLDFFKPPEDRPFSSQVRMIFVGRLNKQKGLNYLLDALAALAGEIPIVPFILEIIGDGPEKNTLLRQSSALGISDKVLFLGWFDKGALLERYQGADIFISVSLEEGMPNVILEAMACGLPVIASDIPAHRELIEDGANGILVPVQESAKVAEAIKVLMQDRALRKRLGDNGLKKIQQYSSSHLPDFFHILGRGVHCQ